MKIKGKPLVGLDIGSNCIKAIELAPTTEGVAITAYARRDITPTDDLKEVLRDLFYTGKFKTKKVVTAVSGRSVIVRYITMPEMTRDELKNAIKYEASKYIPFEVDEVVLDCQPMEYEKKVGEESLKVKAKEMRVLLVAAKRNIIEDHANILEAAGLWPFIIDVDVFALGNAFELYSMLASSREEREKSVALVDIGATKTCVNIMYNVNSYFTREIYIAGNDFTEAISKKMGLELTLSELLKREPKLKQDEVKEATAGVLENLCHEIKLSFDYYEHQFERSIDMIYLSGGGAQLVGLDECFERTFEKKPIRWNPIENIEIASEYIDPAELNNKSTQLIIALGLAFRIKG